MQCISVSALNEQIKHLLEESFSQVLVEGELSRITFHNSGHIYFTLKDENSAISCVMFRGNATRLKFRLEEGLKVIINGAISVYKPRGSYQINCFSIEPSGQGALALAYEQLKKKLLEKGYFDETKKQQPPRFPSRIAIITSATSAALQDMLRVADKRYRLLHVDIYDTLVQGEGASLSIAKAIKKADQQGYDAIIVGRGGGSMEDLWAFNEEVVADAIFEAKTPIISAVGHEIDYALSDFVADLRAATPSVAMELLLPDTNELYQYIDSIVLQFEQHIDRKIQININDLKHTYELYQKHSIDNQIEQKNTEIINLKEQFLQYINHNLSFKQNQLQSIQNMLQSADPKFKIKDGFAQISKNGKVVSLESLHVEDVFSLQSARFIISAKVLKKEKI